MKVVVGPNYMYWLGITPMPGISRYGLMHGVRYHSRRIHPWRVNTNKKQLCPKLPSVDNCLTDSMYERFNSIQSRSSVRSRI